MIESGDFLDGDTLAAGVQLMPPRELTDKDLDYIKTHGAMMANPDASLAAMKIDHKEEGISFVFGAIIDAHDMDLNDDESDYRNEALPRMDGWAVMDYDKAQLYASRVKERALERPSFSLDKLALALIPETVMDSALRTPLPPTFFSGITADKVQACQGLVKGKVLLRLITPAA